MNNKCSYFFFTFRCCIKTQRGTFSPRSETVIQRDELQIVCGLMQIKSKEASQFTYIYVCIKKKTNRSKTKPNAENTHFGKIAFNPIDYKKTINQEYFTSKSNGHFWL